METIFWHRCWENNQIGFHEKEANPLLVQYLNELSLAPGNRVFLPLCGKTLDIPWLVSQGYHVVGIELSQMAIDQFFNELGVVPDKKEQGDLLHYSTDNIDIYVGDIFNLNQKIMGQVDGVYDRGALVALPDSMRNQYTSHLKAITDIAPQLLICFEYQDDVMQGPPFSISSEELDRHYGDSYTLTLLGQEFAADKFNSDRDIKESVWLLG